MTNLSINANELQDIETPDRHQMWGPPITEGNLVTVYASTGVGKTYAVLAMVHGMSTGTKFLRYTPSKKYKVLYIEGELGTATMKKRYNMIQAASPLSPRGDYFRVLTKDQCGGTLWNISDPEMQKRYNAQIGDADVIVIDNLMCAAFLMDKRDDEIAMWNRLAPWLFMLRDTGRTVIMIAHTNKAGVFAGVQTKMNLMDTVIELKPPEVHRPIAGTEFDLYFRKTRDVKKIDAAPMHVEYLEGPDGISRWSWSPLEDNQYATIRQMKEEGMTRRQAAKQLGMSYREIQYAWNKWETQHED